MEIKYLWGLLIILAVFSSCMTGPKITRIAADESVELSGRWNDTDSRLTAETMVVSMLSGAWLNRFILTEGRIPVIIVGSIRNRSSEHIDSTTFIKDIERELINSGKITFVVAGKERDTIRLERENQQSYATESSSAALAAETGADYMMQGIITSETDAIEGKKSILYKVNIELINLESNQKVWLDTTQIKKLIERPSSSW